MVDEKFLFAICFVVFVAIVFRPTKRAILGMIDAEVLRIKKELESATIMRLEAEKTLQALRNEIALLEAENARILEVAQRDIDDIYARSIKDLDEVVARKERDIECQLEYAQDLVIKNIRNDLLAQVAQAVEMYAGSGGGAKLDHDPDIANRLMFQTGSGVK